MKILVLAVFLTLAFSAAASAQKCKEYTTPASAFAFCPPAGWQGKQEKGRKHLTFETTDTKVLPAVMTVDEDTVPVERETFALRLIQGTLAGDKEHTLRAVVDVETTSGIKGTALVFGVEKDGVKLTQMFFVFAGPNDAKFTFVATGPAADESIGKALEVSLRTVRIK